MPDVVDAVARNSGAIGLVTDVTLEASASKHLVWPGEVLKDSGGSQESRHRWGLFAYLPLEERDDGQLEIADDTFLKCVVPSLKPPEGEDSGNWAQALRQQASWLTGRQTRAAILSRYEEKTAQSGPRIFRPKCPGAPAPICDLDEMKPTAQ